MKYTPYEKYINFLKKHNIYSEEILMYIKEFATYFDYYNENQKDYPTSTFPVIDKQKRIIGIRTVIPVITDDITVILNIKEYIKAYLYYDKIGKKSKEKKDKHKELALQLFYEKLYILENPTKELLEYKKELDRLINEEDKEKYIVALNSEKDLLEFYSEGNDDIKRLEPKAKTLTRKYLEQYKK